MGNLRLGFDCNSVRIIDGVITAVIVTAGFGGQGPCRCIRPLRTQKNQVNRPTASSAQITAITIKIRAAIA